MLALNHNLQTLLRIAQKEEKLGIGLMSGTSLDGLDIALCTFKGNGLSTSFQLLNFSTFPYTTNFKADVLEVFAQKTVSLTKLTLLNEYIGTLHGEMVLQALKNWGVSPSDVDFIASHGQTIYHAPKRLHHLPDYPNGTLQIGDGDHLAAKTGIFTIADFRQKHIAHGGEGAPLALYGDVILGSKPGENRILLNIGGIANLTYLPGDNDTEAVLCTDIGPGNTLIDASCRLFFNLPFDEDAKIANSGTINEDLLEALCGHLFFTENTPKTTGPELFNLDFVKEMQRQSNTINISNLDLLSTLTVFTAKAISDFIINNYSHLDIKLFVSGGGARNPFIINYLKKAMPKVLIENTQSLGINPDAKEAILFALLGNEALCGEPIKIGNNPCTLMGKFCFPK